MWTPAGLAESPNWKEAVVPVPRIREPRWRLFSHLGSSRLRIPVQIYGGETLYIDENKAVSPNANRTQVSRHMGS